MKKNQNISLAQIGMSRDKATDSLDERSYGIAVNMNSENESGGQFKLKSEHSNILASRFKDGFKVIGREADEVNNRTFFFLTNPETSISEIGVIEDSTDIASINDVERNCKDCDFERVLSEPLEGTNQPEHQVYTTLLEDSCNFCLNFDINHPIKRIVIKNEKAGTKIFFTDNYNEPRYFDESKLELYKQTGSDICDTDTIQSVCVNCDRLRMFPKVSPISITPEQLVLGGNLPLGRYSFYAAYSDKLGQEISEYASLTQPISVFDPNNKILTNLEETQRTNFAIKLSVSNIDPNFEYYKVIVVVTNAVDGGTRYFEVGTFPATNGSVLFTTEQDKTEVTINDLLLPQPNVTQLEGLTEASNYLIGYGVTREKEWNLQPVVNLLGGFLKWQTHITTEDVYEDGVNAAKFTGYMRDEVYPHAIVFKTNTGYKTARFPFIGRPATLTDLETIVGNDDIDSLNANVANCSSGARDKRWQIYNTASEIGQCDPGNIPTNIIVEPVVKISTTPLDPAGAGSFIIENPEEFTTLENFINQVLEDGCVGFPFCAAADPTSKPDNIPTFTDCAAPDHDPADDIVEVVSITGEALTNTYFIFPDDYSKLKAQSHCNKFLLGEDGYALEDEEFQNLYFPGVNHVYYRDYTFTNDRPKKSLEIVPVDDPSDPISNLFFHNYLGADEGSSPATLAALVETGFTATSSSGSGFGSRPYSFESTLHKQALWFEVDLVKYPETILEILKGYDPVPSTLDIVPVTDNVRLTFYEGTTAPQTALYSIIYNAKNGATFRVTYSNTGTLTVEDEDLNVVINEASYQGTTTNKKLYFTLDCALDIEHLGTNQTAVVTTTKYCFGVALRYWEIDFIEAEYTDITFERFQKYTADCNFEVPIVNQCTVAPYKYGEFAYWESVETYPDNEELFNSRGLDIRISDFTNPDNAVEFQTKYASGINQDRYLLSEETDFTCKPIRHFKYPDNKVSPFMYEFPQAGFTKALIYPLGLTIDDSVINDFLDIAVKNNLITQSQRDSIVEYEIFRGDRSIDKGVVAKGLLYDMYKYEEDNKEILFPNFPYNDLGENQLIYNEDRSDFIQHPYGSDFNHNFTFHSPDTEFYKPTLPSDLKIEGYAFGMSSGVFEDVEDHPKYVILGDDARRLASTLATLEVIAEAAIIAAESAEVYRVQLGVSNSANPIGIGLNIAATALNIISAAVFKYGRYKYQWIETFRNLGSPTNFAKFYTSVGEYNYLQPLQEEGDTIRGINKGIYLNSGRAITVNEVGAEKLEINNVDRENSVFLTLGPLFPITYPIDYKGYDNKDTNRSLSSRFFEGESINCTKGRSKELQRNIASPYVSLKNFLPSQYGSIDSIDWLTTSYKGDLLNPVSDCKPIFGGDTFIARHTLKRKTPLFLTTAMGLASRTPFNYKSYGNFGTEPRFYANFLSPDVVEIDRGLPDIRTEYVFDCLEGQTGFYVVPPSKFYLYYYGIPSFLTETTINLNYRTAKPEPKNLFWPLVGDFVEWTQQNNVSIREPNNYFYNSVYSSNPRFSIGRTLPSTYTRELFDVLYDSPSGLIFSAPDNNENDLTEPWLSFRPLDKYDFATSYGKLVEVKGIESGQILARFDRTVAVFNAFDTLVDEGSKPDVTTLGDGFRRRPVTFTETDLGFAGSQSFDMVSNEMGHFFPDAKRGQIFHIEPGAKGINEISAYIGKNPSGMRNWFKEHLPFRIKNSVVQNYNEIDVDNPYNGIGITMGWDSRYKRVFLTKRDYKPLKESLYAEGNFYKTGIYQSVIDDYISQGYTYDGIVGSNLQFSKETISITESTDVYAIFDTTSMQVTDGEDAAAALQTWFSNYQAENPSYTGNLYIIPYGFERYLAFPTNIKLGSISVTVSGGWGAIAVLPPNLNTGSWVPPTEILLLAFVDESNTDYHSNTVADGFGTIVQPTLNFFQDYENFIDDYTNHYTFFKAALYPIVQSLTGNGGALVLQSMAAIKGRTLTQPEIDATQTAVDVSLLLTTNPYENAAVPGSVPAINLQPLEDLGWTGFFNKTSPASAVFSGAQFQADLNNLINAGGQTSEIEIVTEPLEKVDLTNTEFFKDVSFTIAYNASTGSWVSYYDFKPNYYVNHNNYFQTGVNVTTDSTELGLWSHLLTNKSYGVFYGKKYEITLEYPIKNNYASKTLEGIQLWTEALRYHNEYDFAYNRDINFNKLSVFNNREASGDLRLVPQKSFRDNRNYPKTIGNYQEILITNTNDKWNINYLFNRVVKENLNQPIFNWDPNQIRKTYNNSIVKFTGKRILEPLRGDFFLVNLGYDLDSRYSVEFKWATNTEDLR